jgi:hypothetical protein
VGTPGFYVKVYNKGGNQKAGVLEDTLMSEKEAQERAGGLREANRAAAASAAPTPPIGAKALGTLRGILHGSKRASPNLAGSQYALEPPEGGTQIGPSRTFLVIESWKYLMLPKWMTWEELWMKL